MLIDVVDTGEGLAGLASAWERLRADAGTTDVLSSHHWVANWWAHFGRAAPGDKIFLRDGDDGFGENFVEVPVTGESGVGELRFRVGAHAAWRGRITGLRLDLVDRRVPFLIERVRAIERVGE